MSSGAGVALAQFPVAGTVSFCAIHGILFACMLDSPRRQAEEAILDQRVFFLDAKAHEKFLALLDLPTRPSRGLKALMARKPAWER